MIGNAPTRDEIHSELERARTEFHSLIENSTPADLARSSNGTRWTNRELLFHMLFGYLITWNLRYLVKVISRAPRRLQSAFADALDSATRPFHVINYWGSRLGGRIIRPHRMVTLSDRVIGSLHRQLAAETEASLERQMAFPIHWDPYFSVEMTMRDLYHYATLHFDHHRRQLALDDLHEAL